MHVRGLHYIKVGFKGQHCIRGRQGFYSSWVEGFQIGDLVTKIGRVTGAEHKHNKLVPPETKTSLQSGCNNGWP